MLVLRAERRGNARAVVRCHEEEAPGVPGPLEALVELELSPIDPIDRLLLHGSYPGAPNGSWTPGAEGCARVLDTGSDCALAAGQRVVLPIHQGAWRPLAVHPAEELFAVPADVSAEVAATLRINGLSAWVLVTGELGLEAGDWLLQAPGGGGLARYVIQLARKRGIKTVNVVRDRSQIADLQALGADQVMTYEMLAASRRSQLCGGAEIHVALDGVGGSTTAALGRMLAPGGRVVTYGSASRQAPQLDIAQLVFRGVTLQGFWLRSWTRDKQATEIQQAMESVAAIKPQVVVGAVYSFAQHREAFEHARTARDRVFFTPA